MVFDGVVGKIKDKIYLFVQNPKTKKVMDGLIISGYTELEEKNIIVVDVIFKDGTEEDPNFNIVEFIYGDSYDMNDIFLYIKNHMIIYNTESLESLIKTGIIHNFVNNAIKESKKKLEDELIK